MTRRAVAIVLALAACAARPAVVPTPAEELVAIAGGTFVRGDPRGEAGEEPRPVTVASFRLMRREVTTAQFAAFVAATGYVTDPERAGEGHVWWRHDGRRWQWRRVRGADWRHPYGPGSRAEAEAEAAVVQVSARDAAAFCGYHGLRLPDEDEWEYAARGRDGRRYVWGDTAPAATAPGRRGNVGTLRCCAADDRDGFARVAPVGRFPAARSWSGLDDLVGNVWEWTRSPDERAPGKLIIRGAGWGNSAWCLRAAYRHANPPARGLDMVGFRCATDAAPGTTR